MTYSMALLIGMKKRGKAEIDIMDQELGRKKKKERSLPRISQDRAKIKPRQMYIFNTP